MSDWFANPLYLPVGQPLTPISNTETLGADVPKSSSSDVSIAPSTANYTNVTNVEHRYITYNIQPVQVFSPSVVSLDDARKAGEVAQSASYFSQVRAGNLSITSDAWGGVSLAEANRMPFTSARLLLDADMTASSNNQLFNSLTYAYIANASAYTSMVYRNSMSLIAIAQAAAVSAYTAQYNEIVREDTAAGNNDAITLVHNEYFAQNSSAGTIANMYMTLNQAEWGGTSAEVVTNFYGWHLEDLSSYVTAGRIVNYWNIYAVAGNSAFGGKVRVGSVVAPTVALDVTGDVVVSTTSGNTGTITQSWNNTSTAASASFTQNGTGDAMILFAIGTARAFAMGIDNDDGDSFKITTGTTPSTLALGGIDFVTLTTGGSLMIGDKANAKQTIGLTLNMAGNDDEIISLKSSDVTHLMTSRTEADTYGFFGKWANTNGGIFVHGFSAATTGFGLYASHTTDTNTRSTAANGAINLSGSLHNGSGNITTCAADRNLLVVQNLSTTRFILDSDGDSHQDAGRTLRAAGGASDDTGVGWTNYDSVDDVQVLNAVAVSLAGEDDPLREEFVRHFEENRAIIEAMPGKRLVTFNDDGHHFINMSRLTMLLVGAVRQQADKIRQLEGAVYGINHDQRPGLAGA